MDDILVNAIPPCLTEVNKVSFAPEADILVTIQEGRFLEKVINKGYKGLGSIPGERYSYHYHTEQGNYREA